jgi:hypothetical protein
MSMKPRGQPGHQRNSSFIKSKLPRYRHHRTRNNSHSDKRGNDTGLTIVTFTESHTATGQQGSDCVSTTTLGNLQLSINGPPSSVRVHLLLDMGGIGEIVKHHLNRPNRKPRNDGQGIRHDLGLQAPQPVEVRREEFLLHRLRGEDGNPSNALLPDRKDGVESHGRSSHSLFTSPANRAVDTGCLCAVVRRDVTARGGGLGVERDDVAAFVDGCDLRRSEPACHDVWGPGNEEVGLRGWLDVA